MIQSPELNRIDRSILLRIVGSRKGADLEAISVFEQAHHRRPPSAQEIRESIDRLVTAGLAVQQGNQFFGTPELQNAFFEEVRNCRDTMEEYDVLNRVLAKVRPGSTSDEDA
ncbi:MAG: hypothetical protein AB7F89_11430 [Pirellulaceae bacterium]